MKKVSIRLTSILLAIILISSLTVVAMAATGMSVTKSGVEAYITTNKDSYVTGEEIDAEVIVKNNSGKSARIAVTIDVPQGLTIIGRSNYTAVVQNGKVHASSMPDTGDSTDIILVAVLCAASLCAIVALVIIGKTDKAFMAVLLVLALLGGVGGMAVPAQAATDGIDDVIELTCPIKLDEADANVTATVEITFGVFYEEDFADISGWIDAPAAGIPAGATVGVVDGALKVSVPTSVSSLVGKTRKLNNYTGKVVFEVDVKVDFPEGAPSNKGGAAVVVSTEKGAALAIYFFNGKMGYYNVDRTPSAGVVQTGEYINGTTCRLKLVADTATDTYDILVDGKLLASDVKFRNNGDAFNKIQLSSGATDVGAVVTFDNLRISDAIGYTRPPVVGATVDGTFFEDDFADLEGWKDNPATGIPEGAAADVVDGALKVTVPTTVSAAVGKTHTLASLSGKIAFDMDVKVDFPEGAPNNKGGAAVIVNTNGGASLAVYFFNGKFGYYNVDRTPSAGVTQTGEYISGTTCHLKLVADTATDTYDILVDGKLLASDVKFRNNGDAFNKIQLSSGGTDVGADVTFDNLKVSVATDYIKPPAVGSNADGVFFEDDFADLEGWKDNPATGIPEGAAADVVDGALKITVPTTVSAAVGKTHTLAGLSGKVAFDMDVKVDFPEGAAGSKGGAAIMVNAENGAALAVYFFNGKLGYWNVDRTPSAGVSQIGEYISGTTCHLKLVADTATDTYDILVDGRLVASDVKFRNNGNAFNKIQLSSGGTDVGADVTFDNLKISVPTDYIKPPAVGSTADGTFFEDDFADLEGWNDNPAAGIPEGATVDVVDGVLSLNVPTTVTDAVGKTHTLASLSGKVAFELDMSVTFPEDADTNKAGGAIIVSTDGGASLCFYVFKGEFGYYDVDRAPSAGVSRIGTYTSGTPFRVELVADTETDTYDIFVDGELLISGVKFRNNGDAFNKIQLGSGGNDVGATVTFDNLKIFVP